METSLHRDLKRLYGGLRGQEEVRLGGFRIDAICGRQLVEIQHGRLAAIRDKVRRLLAEQPGYRLLVVKPIVARKRIVRLESRGGAVVSQRLSPKRQGVLAIFDELVHFTRAFPQARLTIEIALVEIEEWRYPGHGRRRWRRPGDHVVADQKLVDVLETRRLRRAADLWSLLPPGLGPCFDTRMVAAHAGVPRWVAQRIAYCLRETGAIRQMGKQGNALVYRRATRRSA